MDEDEEYRRRRQKADEKYLEIIIKYQDRNSLIPTIFYYLEIIYHKLAREPAEY